MIRMILIHPIDIKPKRDNAIDLKIFIIIYFVKSKSKATLAISVGSNSSFATEFKILIILVKFSVLNSIGLPSLNSSASESLIDHSLNVSSDAEPGLFA